MRKLRSGVLIWALIVSGCGPAGPVVTTYPNGTTPLTTNPAPTQPQTPSISQTQPVQPAQPQPLTTPGSFSARFIDSRTGQPIEGLDVMITGGGLKLTTGADGKVSFASVPANAQYQTYHNDFVQVKTFVPANTGEGIDVTLTAMDDFK
jgi:hypothetical protein